MTRQLRGSFNNQDLRRYRRGHSTRWGDCWCRSGSRGCWARGGGSKGQISRSRSRQRPRTDILFRIWRKGWLNYYLKEGKLENKVHNRFDGKLTSFLSSVEGRGQAKSSEVIFMEVCSTCAWEEEEEEVRWSRRSASSNCASSSRTRRSALIRASLSLANRSLDVQNSQT